MEDLNIRRAVVDGREHIILGLSDIEVRESGAGQNYYTLSGHAAIWNSRSHDLGGFVEQLMPGSMTDAIKNSRVHLLFNHDNNFPLASTDSGTLELSEDERGLKVWARIPTDLSYANDLRVLMQNGIARDMSFAFTLPADGTGETWTREADGTNLRTINRVEALYDVSAVVRGAYAAPSFDMRSVFDAAVEAGRLPMEEGASPVAQDDPAGATSIAGPDQAGVEVQRAEALAVKREDRQRRLRVARARTR